jgi:hypothetical protein
MSQLPEIEQIINALLYGLFRIAVKLVCFVRKREVGNRNFATTGDASP